MRIIVNGDSVNVGSGSTVETLLRDMKLEGRIAVEVNGSVVAGSTFPRHILQDGDKVEIVHAVGGG